MRSTILRATVALAVVFAYAAGIGITGFGSPQALQKVTINFPARSGSSWPMFIAREGGYYQKYGLDVDLAFGSGPNGFAMVTSGDAVMTNASMEQALQASSRDATAFTAVASNLNKGVFSLMGAKTIASVKDLKGKRIAVSTVGDAPYNYTVAILSKFKLTARDVSWIQVGTDSTARMAALVGGRADATLLSAPDYFAAEKDGYKSLANLADYNDIYASTVHLFARKTAKDNPKLPEAIIKAHAEAIKRFYEDKAFAIKAFLALNPQAKAEDIDRVYALYAKNKAFERVPYVLTNAVRSVIDQANEQTATQMRSFEPKTVIDNSIVDRLVKEGFFEKTFGPSVKSEQETRSKMAVR